MIERIKAALPLIPDTSEDKRVLTYILAQISPEGLDKRSEWDQDVKHLHEVAKSRLKPYEKEADR